LQTETDPIEAQGTLSGLLEDLDAALDVDADVVADKSEDG